MFDDKDRKELLRILDAEYADARDIILSKESIPSSMTHNSATVGISIAFRKLHETPTPEEGAFNPTDWDHEPKR